MHLSSPDRAIRIDPDSEALRIVKILRDERGFLLDGTQRWAQPSTLSILLHDIFHHHPRDDGSMVCELMSYGAEVWISHHTDEIRLGISPDELSAVIEATAEVKSAEEAQAIFSFPPPPHGPPANVEDRFVRRFKEVATLAFQESAMTQALARIPDKAMSVICDGPNLDCCAGWMAHGFAQARERFPDPEATWQLFNTLHFAIKQWAELGEATLLLELDERRSKVSSPDPDFEQIYRALDPARLRGPKAHA